MQIEQTGASESDKKSFITCGEASLDACNERKYQRRNIKVLERTCPQAFGILERWGCGENHHEIGILYWEHSSEEVLD